MQNFFSTDFMKKLRIHYLQHVSFEGLGCIEAWATSNGHELTCTRFYENDPLPHTDRFDWLIVMGGPMGVYDEEKYAWLKAEKDFIRKTIANNKTLIGICLGSQLIADVLGCQIVRNKQKEIGWFDVELSAAGKKHVLFDDFEKKFKVFHWHGDTYHLTKDQIHLIKSEGCLNQAFIHSNNVLGLQFHFEVTPESLKGMLEAGKHELIPDVYIQTEEEILANSEFMKRNNQMLFSILDKLENS